MAIFANTDAVVTINAVDLSDHVVSCEWTETTDTSETVAMGDEYVTVVPTFKRGTFSVEMQQDHATSEVFDTIMGVQDTNPAAAVTITYKPTSAATAATNQLNSVSAVLTSAPVVSGSIGEIATVTAQFTFTGAVTRTSA